MVEEWHVSDSEEEEIDAFPSLSKLIDNRLYSNKQRQLFSLYEQVANEGFIPLKFPSLKRVLQEEPRKDSTSSDIVVKENSQNIQESEETREKASNESGLGKWHENNPEHPLPYRKKETTVGFDFEEDILDTSVVFPRKTPKSAVKKSKKRVGSMENVINDLNRFRKMSAQIMETEKK